MAVFRIEKTKDHTAMSNHHLRNNELSLKAKGRLSLMMSLPEDWGDTLTGRLYVLIGTLVTAGINTETALHPRDAFYPSVCVIDISFGHFFSVMKMAI